MKQMFGINEVINYIRFLRHKEELEGLIKRHILIKKPKCSVCGFEYNTIEDVYEKLPIITFTTGRNYSFICDKCRGEALDRFFKEDKKLIKNMSKNKKILFYLRDADYGWLSNLERAEQIINNVVYRSNEDYYQIMKGRTKEISDWIKDAPTPYLAMVIGHGLRTKETKKHWDTIKVDIMLKGLRAKFSQNSELKQKLLATGNATLHEDSPTDMFWGIKGKDMLGKLLMQVRNELKLLNC